MITLSFEEFFYSVWSQIPPEIVNESFWEKNVTLLSEITFEYYTIYYKTAVEADGAVISEMETSRVASLLIKTFSIINKIGIK